MEIDAKLVMELRRRTGAGAMDCKAALKESGGDMEKAVDHLRAQGVKEAAKKSGRATKAGFVASYIHHNGMLGTMVEVLCETDFVAREAGFREMCRQIAMHVAAKAGGNQAPICVSRDQVPADLIAREKAIYEQQVADKPAQIRDKIVQGKLETFFKERVLLDQEYAMDDSGKTGTVANLLTQAKAKIGENIVIRRFACFNVGDEVG
jgi:elongation factor Ts